MESEGRGKCGGKPKHCLAIEDSINGVISAKAAQMSVIAVPEEAVYSFDPGAFFGVYNPPGFWLDPK